LGGDAGAHGPGSEDGDTAYWFHWFWGLEGSIQQTAEFGSFRDFDLFFAIRFVFAILSNILALAWHDRDQSAVNRACMGTKWDSGSQLPLFIFMGLGPKMGLLRRKTRWCEGTSAGRLATVIGVEG